MKTRHQFARIEFFAQKSTAQKTIRRKDGTKVRIDAKRKANIAAACGEAARVEAYSMHVENAPHAPNLWGKTPLECQEELERLARETPGIRSNQCLMAGMVISYKCPEGMTPEEAYETPEFHVWQNAMIEGVREMYGDALQSATLHLDESQPHIHFILYNPKDEQTGKWEPLRGIDRVSEYRREVRKANGKAEVAKVREILSDWQKEVFERCTKPLNSNPEWTGERWERTNGRRIERVKGKNMAETRAIAKKQYELDTEVQEATKVKNEARGLRDKAHAAVGAIVEKEQRLDAQIEQSLRIIEQLDAELATARASNNVKVAERIEKALAKYRTKLTPSFVKPPKG